MVMRMKGHNALSPCRMCNIQGVRIPHSSITTHYIPLNHEHFPDVEHEYQANSLPLRNHQTFIKQAMEVHTASTSTASDRLDPAAVVDLYNEFRRMSRLWRWMKKLKWAG